MLGWLLNWKPVFCPVLISTFSLASSSLKTCRVMKHVGKVVHAQRSVYGFPSDILSENQEEMYSKMIRHQHGKKSLYGLSDIVDIVTPSAV